MINSQGDIGRGDGGAQRSNNQNQQVSGTRKRDSSDDDSEFSRLASSMEEQALFDNQFEQERKRQRRLETGMVSTGADEKVSETNNANEDRTSSLAFMLASGFDTASVNPGSTINTLQPLETPHASLQPLHSSLASNHLLQHQRYNAEPAMDRQQAGLHSSATTAPSMNTGMNEAFMHMQQMQQNNRNLPLLQSMNLQQGETQELGNFAHQQVPLTTNSFRQTTHSVSGILNSQAAGSSNDPSQSMPQPNIEQPILDNTSLAPTLLELSQGINSRPPPPQHMSGTSQDLSSTMYQPNNHLKSMNTPAIQAFSGLSSASLGSGLPDSLRNDQGVSSTGGNPLLRTMNSLNAHPQQTAIQMQSMNPNQIGSIMPANVNAQFTGINAFPQLSTISSTEHQIPNSQLDIFTGVTMAGSFPPHQGQFGSTAPSTLLPSQVVAQSSESARNYLTVNNQSSLSNPLGHPSRIPMPRDLFQGVAQFGSAPLPSSRKSHPSQISGLKLPVCLLQDEDNGKLSDLQTLLRGQIEAFEAAQEDITTHTRGRNKPIELNQVGIRCRHCFHLPVKQRQKGSTYFPNSVKGLYQAAQNMLETHMKTGVCTQMPDSIKKSFVDLLTTKTTSSGAGRKYWAESAGKLGLVDMEGKGIRFYNRLMEDRTTIDKRASSAK